MKFFLAGLAALAIAAPTPLRAAELLPAEAYRHLFADGSAALVTYSDSPEGLRVIATWRTDEAAPEREMRIAAIIAPGQSVVLSVPSPGDQPAQSLELRRIGEHLFVTAASAR